jgi:nicotinamidase-related amidase
LLVVDMLNSYDHPDAEPLKESAREVVPVLGDLIETARAHDLPVIWINDNHGDWTAGRHGLTESALEGAGHELIDPIAPPNDAPFVIKARHSIFYGTQMEYMLREHDLDRIILTGQVTEQCILYSALDAYVRHFSVRVASDAVAPIDPELGEAALRMMARNMRADLVTVDELVRGRAGSASAPDRRRSSG